MDEGWWIPPLVFAPTMFVLLNGLMYGNWAPLIWIGAIPLVLGLVWVIVLLCARYSRYRTERGYTIRQRLKAAQEAREALVERALTQHVLLEIGLVENREDKIAKGTHGEYLPYQLDWPKEMTA